MDKALYGTMQAALIWWKRLSSYLIKKLGFTTNPYDECVVNTSINGKQCTIGWYVDDIKKSHVDNEVVEQIYRQLNNEYGKEAPLTVSRGKKHQYLGMDIDYTVDGEVTFSMKDFSQEIVDKCPDSLLKGPSQTPAAQHLFQTNKDGTKLLDCEAKLYHRLTAKLLYLCHRARPDL